MNSAGQTAAAERGRGAPERVLGYQRGPSSVQVDPGPIRRPHPSSCSSSTGALRKRSPRAASRSGQMPASSTSALKMAEVLCIKKELMEIKVQIDGLLDCVDKMDRQRKDSSECPQVREPSVSFSPHRGSVSSLERESPEPGEASGDELLPYQLYCPHRYSHRVERHQSDLEDNL
ncbi:uncharacterized protein LOC144383780 [Gasterosteus aculeatus]